MRLLMILEVFSILNDSMISPTGTQRSLTLLSSISNRWQAKQSNRAAVGCVFCPCSPLVTPGSWNKSLVGFLCWVLVLTQAGGVKAVAAASHLNVPSFPITACINGAQEP